MFVAIWYDGHLRAVCYHSCSIGLQGSEGIGLIGYNSATLVTLGGCPLENRVYQYTIANTSASAVCVNNADAGLLEAKLGPPSSSYMCAVSAVALMSVPRHLGWVALLGYLSTCPQLSLRVQLQACMLQATGCVVFCLSTCLLLHPCVAAVQARARS